MNRSKLPLFFITMALFVTSLASAQQTQPLDAAQRRFFDDAIVRDLKAGKLTVREAQMLRDRHPLPSNKAVTKKTAVAPVRRARMSGSFNASKPKAVRHPVRPGLSGKSSAPVQRLTRLSGKGKTSRQASRQDVATKRARQEATGRVVSPRTAKASTSFVPVRKTAVKYIR